MIGPSVKFAVKFVAISGLCLSVLFAAKVSAQPPADDEANYGGKNTAHWIAQLKLTDQPKRVRWLAAYALGRIAPKFEEAVAALAVAAAEDDDLTVNRYSVYALGRIGPAAKSATPKLVSILQRETDPFYRRATAHALGRIGSDDEEAVKVLTASLADEKITDGVYRAEAALALWKIKQDPDALRVLVMLLKGDEPQARYQATMALTELGDAARPAGRALLTALLGDDADVRRGTGRVLGGIGTATVGALAKMLAAPDSKTRRSAADAIGWVAEDVQRRLAEDVELTDEKIATAVKPLKKIAVPALITALADKDFAVGHSAASALGRIGIAAVPILVDALTNSKLTAGEGIDLALAEFERYYRPVASFAPLTGEVKKSTLPLLKTAFEKGGSLARYRAAKVFLVLGYGPEASDAEPALQEALKDESGRVRAFATQALQRIKATP